MKKFGKRTYKSPMDFLRDLWFPLRNADRLREMTKSGQITRAFRERLMLAVTAVNECRYCSYFHARQALNCGVSEQEISGLLQGEIGECPEEETVALAFAQHWAESDARPDPEALSRPRELYGAEKADMILMVLRMIRMGNLTGNTWDFILYRLSFGRFGG